MQQKQKIKKIKDFRILVTGDNNYNNINKFSVFMDSIYQKISETKTIATFDGKYGAEILAQIYAQQKLTNFKTFTTEIFKNNSSKQEKLYHILLSIAVKWSDLVIIFSNVYNNKIKQIIKLCKKNNIQYLLIKQ